MESKLKSGALTLLVAHALLSVVSCSSPAAMQGPASAGQPSGSAGQAASAAGTSQGGASGAETSATSGAVAGPSDGHCAGRPLGISDPAICMSFAGASSFAGIGGAAGTGGESNAASGGANAGAGGMDCNQSHDAGYGDNLYDFAGDDDDCKYHVSWTSTPVQKGKPFTLTITATSKATGEPLVHIAAQDPGKPALSRIEPFMPCQPSHLAPTQTTKPQSPKSGQASSAWARSCSMNPGAG